MDFSRGFKFNFLILKYWFDVGFGWTNYVKYFIALFGISSLNVKATLIIAFLYGVLCFILGFLLCKYKWIDVQNDISNMYNPFVSEMRNSIRKRKV